MLKAIRQNMGRAVYFTSNANNAEMEREKKESANWINENNVHFGHADRDRV